MTVRRRHRDRSKKALTKAEYVPTSQAGTHGKSSHNWRAPTQKQFALLPMDEHPQFLHAGTTMERQPLKMHHVVADVDMIASKLVCVCVCVCEVCEVCV